MKRIAIAIAVVGLVGAACKGGGGGSLGPGPSGPSVTSPPASPSPSAPPSPSPSAQPTPTPTTTPSASPTETRTVTFEVWFLADGQLFVTERTEPFVPAVAGLALDALVDGPSSIETDAGVTTALPNGVGGGISALSGGTATVDLDAAFFEGDDASVRLRQAQVVYTLSQYATIQRVAFTSEGSPVGTDEWARADYEDLLPAILVESPVIGDRVSNPVTVSGTANVFEATVSLRILDEQGNEIASTFTTATCGSGCRGDFSVAVDYSVDHEQPGMIEVYESSAKDGSAINVVTIPVILTP
jgi:hypothetical protein